MQISLSSTLSSSSASALRAPPKAPDPTQVFNDLDTDQKGYLTVSDLASAVVNISSQGSQLSADDAQAQAEEMFAKMDSDGDGQVTLSEFEDAAPPTPPAGSPPAQGGAGGGGAPPPAASSSSSSQTYDPADTNEDGTVSETERQAYAAKHPTQQDTAKPPPPPPRDRVASEAVDTYTAVANAA
jgi:hypothetical protein